MELNGSKHADTNSGKLEVASITFGCVWSRMGVAFEFTGL